MFNRKKFIVLSILFILFTLPLFRPLLLAQVIPSYNVRNIIAGNVADIQVGILGSGGWGNLGLILRVTTTRTDSFDIVIPAGTLFGGLSPGKNMAVNEYQAGAQSFLTVFGDRARFPGGRRPEADQAINLNSYVNDILIYALCYDVRLPLPDTNTVFNPTVDSLESVDRIARMIQGFENFNIRMQQIDSRIKAGQTLTDEETRYAAFIDWQEIPGQLKQAVLLKNDRRRKNQAGELLPYAKFKFSTDRLATYPPEIHRETAQNVLWTMAPEDQDFSPAGVRNDISYALNIQDADSLDDFIRPANSLLELLGLERRLLIIDSLRYPIAHFINYPPYYITWWDGPGGGWAARMSLPYEKKYQGCKWQILEVSFYLQSDNAGNFQAAILEDSNGTPGGDLMNQKTVSFPELPYGGFITVDVSSENIIVEGDFFIGLFQTVASNPAVVISEAINGRSFGFNGVNWSAEALSLFFKATLRLVNSAPTTPVLISPAGNQSLPADQAKFVWTTAKDPDAGNIVTYQLQFALQSDFGQLLHREQNLSDTTFLFSDLPQSVRDQMNNRIIYWQVRAQDNFGGVSPFSAPQSFRLEAGNITNSHGQPENLPVKFALHQNYPNPFNPYTVIKFDVPVTDHISIKIFNAMGQMVKTLVDQPVTPGYHQLSWDGTDQQGRPLSSGVYLVQMKASSFVKMQKITLLH